MSESELKELIIQKIIAKLNYLTIEELDYYNNIIPNRV